MVVMRCVRTQRWHSEQCLARSGVLTSQILHNRCSASPGDDCDLLPTPLLPLSPSVSAWKATLQASSSSASCALAALTSSVCRPLPELTSSNSRTVVPTVDRTSALRGCLRASE
eukprot:CAMPEP_0115351602 /NCGR_PEP_ID=MMETSP0270-20121206/97077_1 /TAXON_ID=71861 /ORGANISM="Scrippsiella trochoidea, Strain CCMP3099" /LENGTH=113 /DNA_ID=CAMNT_0002773753 /DNA_START=45 /DNA_END=383 /DNA_ORIENTATION=+